MEDYGVIEQECDHIDFDVEENGKIVVEEKKEVVEEKKEVVEEVNKETGEVNPNFIYKENLKKKEVKKYTKNQSNEHILDRCIFIKKDGKQCRQRGKPSQSGGPIINGYCSYHRNKN